MVNSLASDPEWVEAKLGSGSILVDSNVMDLVTRKLSKGKNGFKSWTSGLPVSPVDLSTMEGFKDYKKFPNIYAQHSSTIRTCL